MDFTCFDQSRSLCVIESNYTNLTTSTTTSTTSSSTSTITNTTVTTSSTTSTTSTTTEMLCPTEVLKTVSATWREGVTALSYVDGCQEETGKYVVSVLYEGKRFEIKWSCTCVANYYEVQWPNPPNGYVVNQPGARDNSNRFTGVIKDEPNLMFATCQTSADCGGCAPSCESKEFPGLLCGANTGGFQNEP